jgi:hypothetical protein
MKLESANRKQWGVVLVIATGVTIASPIIALLLSSMTAWLWMLLCWVGLLSVGAVILALMGLVTNGPLPSFRGSWDKLPWAAVGGVLGFGIVWVDWLFTRSQPDDVLDLGCFGPMLGLMAFAIAGAFQFHLFFLLMTFAVMAIAAELSPWIGDLGTLLIIVAAFLLNFAVGIYFRVKWGVDPSFPAHSAPVAYRILQKWIPLVLLFLLGVTAVFLWWYAN